MAARYGFLHALYQEVLYAQVAAGRRSQLHQRIGERLEAAYGERRSEIAVELAEHFEQGGEERRAVFYHRQAAQIALQRSASQEAVNHLVRGVDLLQALPGTAERAADELTLQITLGPVLMATRGYAHTH